MQTRISDSFRLAKQFREYLADRGLTSWAEHTVKIYMNMGDIFFPVQKYQEFVAACQEYIATHKSYEYGEAWAILNERWGGEIAYMNGKKSGDWFFDDFPEAGIAFLKVDIK